MLEGRVNGDRGIRADLGVRNCLRTEEERIEGGCLYIAASSDQLQLSTQFRNLEDPCSP